MPKSQTVREILQGLWTMCSAEASGADRDCDWSPKGEFCFRPRRKSKDRIFRVRDFEGRRVVKGEETDGGPGRGGIDLLGKYTLSNSMVTIYVDSCRRVELEYCDGDCLKELIEVVLIHELAHLITHKGFELKKLGGDADHVWEYTAQCTTYAYLKTHGKAEDLKVFEQLSPHQPFIYRTWEGLMAVESVRHSEKLIADVVKSVFNTIKPPPPPERENMAWEPEPFEC